MPVENKEFRGSLCHEVMEGSIDRSHVGGTNVDFAVFDPRCEELGLRFYAHKTSSSKLFDPRDVIKVSSPNYDALRYAMMIPEGSECVDGIPARLNFDLMGSLDLKKGCFLGQELTARAYYTGVVRKRPYLVIAHPPDFPLDPNAKDVRLSLLDTSFTASLKGRTIKDKEGRTVLTIIGNFEAHQLTVITIVSACLTTSTANSGTLQMQTARHTL